LKEAHCYDQVDLHKHILCYEDCEFAKKEGAESCGQSCDGLAHKKCRDGLMGLYKVHITEYRSLDAFVYDFSTNHCPVAEKECCLLEHSTWNCGNICATRISNYDVNADFGAWLFSQISKFEVAHHTWTNLHLACTAAYHDYVEKDAKCDCEQARCETANCEWDTCHFENCEVAYQGCWAGCDAAKEGTDKEKECLEKDRKIDWSATEKIECYVNVLLEKPTPEKLLAECGTADCYNVYREAMYKKCNTICVEVDFTNKGADGLPEFQEHDRRVHIDGVHVQKQTNVKDQATHQGVDQDVTSEGVNSVRTVHRGTKDQEKDRCTSHLDLDYQLPPCCHPCEERPSPPCEEAHQECPIVILDSVARLDGGALLWPGKLGHDHDHDHDHDHSDYAPYMWLHYGQYGHLCGDDIDGFSAKICKKDLEHTQVYAYNLCDCLDCPTNVLPPNHPTPCVAGRACADGTKYDYRKHDITVVCDDPLTYGGGGGAVEES